MERWARLAVVLLLGCPASPVAPREVRTNLRVPLPDGWRAQGSQGALLVGPPGAPVAQLESLTRELPALEHLITPLKREKVTVLSKESDEDFRAVRYRLAEGGEAFLAVHRLAGRTVWCASLNGARADDVTQALQLCRGLGADAGVEEVR
jgi:hypothetical protein